MEHRLPKFLTKYQSPAAIKLSNTIKPKPVSVRYLSWFHAGPRRTAIVVSIDSCIVTSLLRSCPRWPDRVLGPVALFFLPFPAGRYLLLVAHVAVARFLHSMQRLQQPLLSAFLTRRLKKGIASPRNERENEAVPTRTGARCAHDPTLTRTCQPTRNILLCVVVASRWTVVRPEAEESTRVGSIPQSVNTGETWVTCCGVSPCIATVAPRMTQYYAPRIVINENRLVEIRSDAGVQE